MIKKLIVKFLILTHLYQPIRNLYWSIKLRNASTEEIFTNIFKTNRWQGKNSVSGRGSDLDQTAIVVKALPEIFKDFEITKMLDIPCGDFHWMNTVDLTGIDYIGGDIVKDLIDRNNETYKKNNVHFQYLNLITGSLPKVDLIFCRDCFVHLSFENIFQALNNICNSKAKYILTTTFPDRKNNYNIITGDFRLLNLELAPFNFPKPIKVINEGCTESNGEYADKSLALWKINDLKTHLNL